MPQTTSQIIRFGCKTSAITDSWQNKTKGIRKRASNAIQCRIRTVD